MIAAASVMAAAATAVDRAVASHAEATARANPSAIGAPAGVGPVAAPNAAAHSTAHATASAVLVVAASPKRSIASATGEVGSATRAYLVRAVSMRDQVVNARAASCCIPDVNAARSAVICSAV